MDELRLPEGIEEQARAMIERSIMTLDGEPVGTVAARDDRAEPVNYDHCFVRDFVVSAVVFLLEGRPEIVRNFLALLVDVQSREKSLDCFDPGRGLMPASFKVIREDGEERVLADFGESAIARVTPVDSGFWWLLLLRTYTRYTGDTSLVEDEKTREAIRLIVDLSLTSTVELLPTLLVPDGAFMIDRRLGVYGHPLDVQVLFFAALRAAAELLPDDDALQEHIRARLGHLTHHLLTYYWLDLARLNDMHRFPVEEFGVGIVNHFNLYPEAIPAWLLPWIPDDGGYFTANVGAGRMDFRFLAQGNLLAVVMGLSQPHQTKEFLRLLEDRWDVLVADMPMKLCYPALEDREWEILTGRDAKNRPWTYHNGGSWPCLLWQLTAMTVRAGREDLAHRALTIAGRRIAQDEWPEYYDTRLGRLIGGQARMKQTWTAAGFLGALQILRNPGFVDDLGFVEGVEPTACEGPGDLSVRADPVHD